MKKLDETAMGGPILAEGKIRLGPDGIVARGKKLVDIPRAEFSDAYVTGWSVGPDAVNIEGRVDVNNWDDARIARWKITKRRWDRYGRRVPKEMHDWPGVRRLARKVGVPLARPEKQSTAFVGNTVETDTLRQVEP